MPREMPREPASLSAEFLASLPDPREVCRAEYRVVYELLDELKDDGDADLALLVSVLDELIAEARAVRDQLIARAGDIVLEGERAERFRHTKGMAYDGDE